MDVKERMFEPFDYIDEHSLGSDAVLLKELNYVNDDWESLPNSKIDVRYKNANALSYMVRVR
jgi:hypothetical protein